MSTIAVVGSYNYDLVTQVPVVPGGGETVSAKGFATHYGGKGANGALALRRLGGQLVKDVVMIGCVGDDLFGKELIQNLKNEGVNTQHTHTIPNERTGTATILVEDSGENRIMVYPGANQHVNGENCKPEMWQNAQYVVLQNEIDPKTTFGVLEQASKIDGLKSVFNPSPLPKIPISEWPFIDIIVVNETEAQALTGVTVSSTKRAFEALPHLLKYCGLAIITLGANGVTWQERGSEPGFLPAVSYGKVVDTTGAGDSFLASFITQNTNPENSIADCIKFATKVSGIVVTREGASSSIPRLEEIDM